MNNTSKLLTGLMHFEWEYTALETSENLEAEE